MRHGEWHTSSPCTKEKVVAFVSWQHILPGPVYIAQLTTRASLQCKGIRNFFQAIFVEAEALASNTRVFFLVRRDDAPPVRLARRSAMRRSRLRRLRSVLLSGLQSRVPGYYWPSSSDTPPIPFSSDYVPGSSGEEQHEQAVFLLMPAAQILPFASGTPKPRSSLLLLLCSPWWQLG